VSFTLLGFTCNNFQLTLVVDGPYIEHIKDGWNHRNDKNVLFLFYEDLKSDLKSSLRKLADFLGHELNDGDLPMLMQHLSVDSFKQNSSVNKIERFSENNFIRRGQVGGNPEMTAEIAAKIDEWCRKKLEGSDLKFTFY